MKQLENIVTIEGGHTATLVKRNDKAAIYKRETAEGQFVSFEVFALLTKNGMEIYPNQTAVKNRWCMCPMTEAKANTWFDRFTNGDVAIPNVDPVTGEPIEKVDNRNLDELPDVNVSVDVPAPLGSHDNPVMLPAVDPTDIVSIPEPVAVVTDIPSEVSVDIPAEPVAEVEVPVVDDPTAPDDVPVVEVPEVTPTVDGGALVTVAVVKAKKVYPTLKLPVGEFLRDDFAELNGMDHHPAHSDSYGPLMREIKEGRVIEVRKEKRGPGKPRSIYSAVTVSTPATV